MRRALREAAGVSLRDVAEVCDVSRECVRLWELGLRDPSGSNLSAYLKVLEILQMEGRDARPKTSKRPRRPLTQHLSNSRDQEFSREDRRVTVDEILGRLDGVKRGLARCPAHDDHNPSLSVSEGKDGRVLLHCFAGCETSAILERLGLTEADLFPANRSAGPTASRPSRSTSGPKTTEADLERFRAKLDTRHLRRLEELVAGFRRSCGNSDRP